MERVMFKQGDYVRCKIGGMMNNFKYNKVYKVSKIEEDLMYVIDDNFIECWYYNEDYFFELAEDYILKEIWKEN